MNSLIIYNSYYLIGQFFLRLRRFFSKMIELLEVLDTHFKFVRMI